MIDEYKICESVEECLTNLKSDNQVAIGVSREYVLHRTDIFCFDRTENIFSYTVSMLVRKNDELYRRVNKFIHHLLDAGLMKKWTETTFNVLRKGNDSHGSSLQVKPISIQHITVGFIIAILFVILSVIAFGLELLIYKKLCSKNPSSFWIKAELLIDGDRHYFLLK